MYKKIVCEIEDRIALITINDPEKHNAMRLLIREEMVHALKSMEKDDTADAVLITGMGSKAFSAGADINEVKTRTLSGELSTEAQLRRELPALLERIRLPTIACINGYCLGAGLELALACTLRVANQKAVLGLPEINLGVIPGSGGTQRLARVVGMGRAMEMVTLGEPIKADTAHDIGLVNRVFDNDSLISGAREIARKWQKKGPVSLMASRDAVLRSADNDIASGIDYENKLFALCIASGERDEGVDAFLGKREAVFRKK